MSTTMSTAHPSTEQLAYAAEVVARRRQQALEKLLTGEHRDDIASMVFSYTESDDDPTPDKIAEQILRYMAEIVGRLLHPDPAIVGLAAVAEIDGVSWCLTHDCWWVEGDTACGGFRSLSDCVEAPLFHGPAIGGHG